MPSHVFNSDLVCSIKIINNCNFIVIQTNTCVCVLLKNYSKKKHNLHKICFKLQALVYSKIIIL